MHKIATQPCTSFWCKHTWEILMSISVIIAVAILIYAITNDINIPVPLPPY